MEKTSRKNIQDIFVVIMVVIFVGEIYINPFAQWFRFSFAVVILSILLLYFKDISIVITTSITGVCVCFFRSFVYFMAFNETDLLQALVNYFPAIIFYIVFGILFWFLNIRDKTDNLLYFVLSLWLCDTISNFVETSFRRFFVSFSFNRAVILIIVIGLVRTFITALIYHVILCYKNRYEREQKENRYKKSLIFLSKLKAEAFFLEKSKDDIEKTMEKSYKLYENIQDSRLKKEALNIARNIHEIKKDYYRVLVGIQDTLSQEKENISMDVKAIFDLIKENTQKIIDFKQKNILLHFCADDNFEVNNHYLLISILNNLIINSIDAIESSGKISVIEYKRADQYLFQVSDTGFGIEEEDLIIIYKPGYSTKYDQETGKMSQGLGLSHVKSLVENNYNGKICVDSRIGKGTIFEIIIPANKIEIVN